MGCFEGLVRLGVGLLLIILAAGLMSCSLTS
jgi:hypothetical protein